MADDRVSPPLQGDERETLSAFLDFLRGTIVKKCRGLSQEQLGTSLPPSTMTLAGILKHLALVEDWWFQNHFAGQGMGHWDAVDFDSDPDWEWRTAADDEPTELLREYEAACERSRSIVAVANSLDQLSVNTLGEGGECWSLRWIVVHMIEETARHAGHADLLRESIDGETGD